MKSNDMTLSINFDEQSYLDRYPDVKALVQDGSYSSGKEHFLKEGMAEGRSSDKKVLWRKFDEDNQRLVKWQQTLNLRTVSDANRLVLSNLFQFHQFDFIVGVPRSGVLISSLIALHCNIPHLTLKELYAGDTEQIFSRRKNYAAASLGKRTRMRILVIDDSVGSGGTIDAIRRETQSRELHTKFDLVFLGAYVESRSAHKVDISLEIIDPPRVFEWNMMHNVHARLYCVDMDGVLCEDPLPSENDDGPRYLEFIQNARPKVLPSVGVGMVVTARLERYRALTADWLSRHGIKYERLVMLDLPTGEERRKMGAHAIMKADVYRTCGGLLFVESDPWQAEMIFKATGRPVFCYGDSRLLR